MKHLNEIYQSIKAFFESKVKNVSLDYLNQLYSEYTEKVERKVEGFVILDLLSGIQTKYVRLKRGKLTEHKA